MNVKRTRATAGIATAFALLAVGTPGAATSVLASSSGGADDTVPSPTPEASFAPEDVVYEPARDVSVEVPTVQSRNLAAASQTTVRRADPVPAGEIPDRALAAYAFAAQAMSEADPDCRLDWSLLAAIGRIESDHGRSQAGKIRFNGRAVPLVHGETLDGTRGTAKVRDTDGGRYDDLRTWDRAVGPMQLLPSTWSYVGVDGDGNGKRNPHDIDDSALAVAVYLCAAADKALADDKGRRTPSEAKRGLRKAVSWFNSSDAYGDLAWRLQRVYHAEYGVSPYSSAPSSVRLQTVALVEPLDAVGPVADTTRARKAANDEAERDGSVKQDDPAKPTQGPDGASKDDDSKGGGPTEPTAPEVPAAPAPTPTPTPDPTPDPEPTPEPEPEPEPPTLVELSGVLDLSGTTFSVAGTPLAFSGDWAAQGAPFDLDGDGTTESNGDELQGAVGNVVTVLVWSNTDPAEVDGLK